MLEKPDLPDDRIIAAFEDAYGFRAARLAFLPIGADVNTAVYRAALVDQGDYFLKLRRGPFDELTVTVPAFLHAQGISHIIASLEAREGRRWAEFGAYTMIVYPFIEGKDGYEVALSDEQWIAFGAAMKCIHAAQLPPDLARLIPREDFSPLFRERVRMFQAQVESSRYDDPVAARLAVFMRAKRDEITRLVDRADELGRILQSGLAEMVLCHSDIHPGNLHITHEGALYIVDWDNPCFAPKEHDLGLIGGDGVGAWNNARAERLFYRGYGEGAADPLALAYYRYERIVQDIAAFCEQVLMTAGASDDREQAYHWMTGQFLPGHEVEIAFKNDRLAIS